MSNWNYPQQYGQPQSYGYYQQPQQYGYPPVAAAPPPPPPAPSPPLQQQQPQAQADSFQPPPGIDRDPNLFRAFFRHQLGTLTFNSRPIITNLTVLAHQNALKMAPVAAQCLDEHIRQSPPQIRLFALYLLDSIAKNVGHPYTALFARFIERVFLETYQLVDPQVKVKLEELLGTWRTGGQDGGELFRFPEEGRRGRVQYGIESNLFGNGGRGGGIGGKGLPLAQNQAFQAGVQQLPPVANQAERDSVLFDIRNLLQMRRNAAALNPADDANRRQVNALQQLEKLVVGSQISPDQVRQIRSDLSKLSSAAARAPPPPPAFGAPPPSAAPSTFNPSAIASALAGVDPNLLAQLSGVLGGAPKSGTPEVADEATLKLKEYDDALVALDVQLTTAAITAPRPEALSFLYDRFPLQCQQCGLRFFETPSGRRQMDAHIDWHFRHRRRVREGAQRTHGRSWLVAERTWLSGDEDDAYGAPIADAQDAPVASTSSNTKAQQDSVSRAELMKKRVPMPSDPAIVSRPCPICKEPFKSEWSEDDEEWVFPNAVDVDRVLYHATCHHDAMAAKTAAAQARLIKAEESREGTPLSASGSPAKIKREGTPSVPASVPGAPAAVLESLASLVNGQSNPLDAPPASPVEIKIETEAPTEAAEAPAEVPQPAFEPTAEPPAEPAAEPAAEPSAEESTVPRKRKADDEASSTATGPSADDGPLKKPKQEEASDDEEMPPFH